MYLAETTLLQGGKYKIARHISSGGFGNTYEGIHTMMDNRVAIKEFFVKDFCDRDEETSNVTVVTKSKKDLVEKLRMKFIEEAKAIFKMKHPNIVHVLDIFEENGTSYYVMDYIDGPSLNDIVKKSGAMPEAKALKYMLQVCDALKYVHSLNRLHLDIKPGNIMIDENDNAILIDFGASKHYSSDTGENTTTMQGLNTPGYAPIEQTVDGITTFTPASDIYAVGATLYKLLTGATPISSSLRASGEELMPLYSHISDNVRDAVMKAMSINKKNRPQNIEEFIALVSSSSESAYSTSKKDQAHSSTEADEDTVFEEAEKKQIEEEARRKAEAARKAAEEELFIQAEIARKAALDKRLKEEAEAEATKQRQRNKESNRQKLWLSLLAPIILVIGLIIGFFNNDDVAQDKIPTSVEHSLNSSSSPNNKGTTQFQLSDSSSVNNVRFTSNPDGANISIDETPYGTTPCIATLAAGSHIVAFRKKGYQDYKDTIQVFNNCDNETVAVKLKLLESEVFNISTEQIVDLGLSVYWSSCNYGAKSPEQFGQLVEYENGRVYMEENWKIPLGENYKELMSKCKWKWMSYKGVYGYGIKGPNGKSIFLPANGTYYNKIAEKIGKKGQYSAVNNLGGPNCLIFDSKKREVKYAEWMMTTAHLRLVMDK